MLWLPNESRIATSLARKRFPRLLRTQKHCFLFIHDMEMNMVFGKFLEQYLTLKCRALLDKIKRKCRYKMGEADRENEIMRIITQLLSRGTYYWSSSEFWLRRLVGNEVLLDRVRTRSADASWTMPLDTYSVWKMLLHGHACMPVYSLYLPTWLLIIVTAA